MSISPESPVPFTKVDLRDSFWAPRQAINRLSTLPHIGRQCEKTGRFAAWDMNWRPGEPQKPHLFWDSDVMKWVEAASDSLALHYDTSLDEQLDHLIAKVACAQMPDGYANSHFISVEPDKRWVNLRDYHELYCAGHLIEAAVAHHMATGKTSLLDIARKYADHIEIQFGREVGKKRGYCGHEEVELALIKLYRTTREPRYLRLAKYFVDERGQEPHYYDQEAQSRGEDPASYYFGDYSYLQAHKPVREQTEVVGHAVRAMYLYSAMADLAAETNDAELLSVCQQLFRQLISKRLYITGGIGSSAKNEGFTEDYDLPNENAYAETCAAIGLAFWSHRMLMLTGSRQYADVLERVLYNGVASGVSLDGQRFFYTNPLFSRGETHRQEWYDCACCPPNIARLMASVGGYFYAHDETGLSVHLFGENEAQMEIDGREVVVRQQTSYPWSGTVKIEIFPQEPMDMTVRVRLPSWCNHWDFRINNEPAVQNLKNGYLHLRREWKKADQVLLTMAMPVQNFYAHPNMTELSGRAAISRGPLIYCLEGVDHDTKALDHLTVPIDDRSLWLVEHNREFLGGATVLHGQGEVVKTTGWGNELYRSTFPGTEPAKITAVPYCVWDNRSPGEMRVWSRVNRS